MRPRTAPLVRCGTGIWGSVPSFTTEVASSRSASAVAVTSSGVSEPEPLL